jgi:hypothetical protein
MAKKTKVWPWVVGGVVVIGGGYLLYRWRKKKQEEKQPAAGATPSGSVTLPYVPSSVLPEVPGGAEAAGWDFLSQLLAALGVSETPAAAVTPATAARAATTAKAPQSPTPGGQVPAVGQAPRWAPIATITVPPAPRPVTGVEEAARILPVEFQVPGRVTQLVPATQSGGEYVLVTTPKPKTGGGRLVVGEVTISTPSQVVKRTAGATQGGGTEPTSFREAPIFV